MSGARLATAYTIRVFQDQGSEGPPPLPLSQDGKGPASENPSATEELDTPTSIASVVTSTNESSMETDTPHHTDNEVPHLIVFISIISPLSYISCSLTRTVNAP